MNKYVVQTVAIYALALLICSFINIDKIAPWYRLEATSQESPLVRGLNKVEGFAQESGVHSAVKKFDCSTAFLFNDTYKDNSDCFLEQEEISDNGGCDPEKMRKLRLMARVLYDQLQRRKLSGTAPRIAHADWTVPAGSVLPDGILKIQYAEQETSAGISVESQDLPATGQVAQSSRPVEKSEVKVEMGANKQLLQQKRLQTSVPVLAPEPPQLHEHDLSPTSILVIGDSLAIGLARSFEYALERYDDVTFARVGKVSSGLAIPHLFDWEKKVQVLIDEYRPNFIVILMGINDANNNIRVDGKKAILGTPSWPVAYQKRVERFLEIIKTKNVPVYWVGLPIVRDEAMTERIWLTNETAKKACTNSSDCRFIDTWQLLTDENGRYTNYKKDSKGYNVRIRAKDGVHFSREGGDLLTNYILDYITKYVDLHPKKASSVSQEDKSTM